MKSLLSIAILIISSSVFAKAPISDYQVRLFKVESTTTEKLWCQNCERHANQSSSRSTRRNNNKNYLTLKVNNQEQRVELQVINVNLVGDERAKELGYDGSASSTFIIIKNKTVVSRTYVLDNNADLEPLKLVEVIENALNEFAKTVSTPASRELKIPSVWELKASGQFNF